MQFARSPYAWLNTLGVGSPHVRPEANGRQAACRVGARPVGLTGIDLRQFGRRSSNISAFAVLPGQVLVPCIIVNLSDGGALLSFMDGAAPTQSFRLVVEDTEFKLLCEVRHRNGRTVGVRFVRLAEGIALNRYFLKTAVEPAAGEIRVERAPTARPASTASVRDLRRAVLGIGATTVAKNTAALEVASATEPLVLIEGVNKAAAPVEMPFVVRPGVPAAVIAAEYATLPVN